MKHSTPVHGRKSVINLEWTKRCTSVKEKQNYLREAAFLMFFIYSHNKKKKQYKWNIIKRHRNECRWEKKPNGLVQGFHLK